MEEVKTAIETFIKGGDTNSAALLESILHPQYRNIQDGFFEEKGIFVIAKDEYIDLVKNKTFGGSPRTIEYRALEQNGNLVNALVLLESEYLRFHSHIVCVRENSRWMVIGNYPAIVQKEESL